MKKAIFLAVNILLVSSICFHYGCSKGSSGSNPTPTPTPTPTDTVVGTASVTPSSGTPGTNITFTVKVNSSFTSKVASISLDISNTGEHIALTKTDNTTWSQNELWAPTASSYPRTDTFTFTAYDSNGNSLGHGSATFKIIGNNIGSVNTTPAAARSRYYGKN